MQVLKDLQSYAGPSSAPGTSGAPSEAEEDDDDDDMVIMDGPAAAATDVADADDDLMIISEVQPPLTAGGNAVASGNAGKRSAETYHESPRKRQKGS